MKLDRSQHTPTNRRPDRSAADTLTARLLDATAPEASPPSTANAPPVRATAAQGPAQPPTQTRIGAARKLLQRELADGPRQGRDLKATAAAAGINERTLHRAALDLGIQRIGRLWALPQAFGEPDPPPIRVTSRKKTPPPDLRELLPAIEAAAVALGELAQALRGSASDE
jgi:hypothetical protein